MDNKKGTYVSMKVKNPEVLYKWYKDQGVDVVPKEELHCTIAYSKKEFKHEVDKDEVEIKYDEEIYPYLEPLGNDGAVVMKFTSKEMQKRFDKCIKEGAIYDYDTYIPHVTISYNGKDLDLKSIRRPDFYISLHNETVEPLNLDWKAEKIESKDMQIFDKGFNKFDKFIDEQTGFLKINGVIARTGIQDYLALELGDTEGDPMSPKGVYRPKSEVLNKDSLESFVNAPITDNHPKEFVNTNNAKELIKGSVSSIETFSKDGVDYVKAKMTVTDKNLINKIMNGKVEISAGYSQDLIKEKGEFQDKVYDYKQTNIKINHVAIVDKGRCGDKCKVTTDKKVIIDSKLNKERKSMIKYKINDAEVEICDTVFAHINDLKKQAEDAKFNFEKEKDEKEVVKGENAKLKEDMEEEKKNKTSDADMKALIDAGVVERVALIDTAKTLNVTVDSSLSPMEIKKVIIADSSKIDLTDKSDQFIDGVYETVIASTIGKAKDIADSQASAFDGFDPKKKEDKNSAYDKYVDGLKNKYKGDK